MTDRPTERSRAPEARPSADSRLQDAARPDSPVVSYNDKTNTWTVVTPQGLRRELVANDRDEIVEVRDRNGVWRRTGPQHPDGSYDWVNLAGNRAMPIHTRWSGHVWTDKQGNYHHKDTRTNQYFVERSDGYTEVHAGGKVAVHDWNNRLIKVREAHPQPTQQRAEKADASKPQAAARPEGQVTVNQEDGSALTISDSGRVLKVVTPQKQTREFKYDQQGRCVEVRDAGGIWRPDKNGVWHNERGAGGHQDVKVDSKGNYTFADATGSYLERPNGKREYYPKGGGTVFFDERGRVVQVTDADKQVRKFVYWQSGEIKAEVTPDGTVWQRRSKNFWETEDRKQQRHGQAFVDGKGTYRWVDQSGKETTHAISGDRSQKQVAIEPKVDTKRVQEAVEDFRQATRENIKVGSVKIGGCDRDAMMSALQIPKTAAEKALMDRLYKNLYGKTIEQEIRGLLHNPEDRERALGLWHGKPGEPDHARRMGAIMFELDKGGSPDKVVQALVHELSNKSRQQIERIDAQFKANYGGKSMYEAFCLGGRLSDDQAALVQLAMKGVDKRRESDAVRMAELSAETRNISTFEAVMKEASPAARKAFMDQGGSELIQRSFPPESHAMDIALYGHVTPEHRIARTRPFLFWQKDDTGVKAIVNSLTDEQRRMFIQGEKFNFGTVPQTDADKKALTFYRDVIRSMREARGSDADIARWSDLIRQRGGTLAGRLAEASNPRDARSTVEQMSREDWQRLRTDRGAFADAANALRGAIGDGPEFDKVYNALWAKREAKTWEEAQKAGRRSTFEIVSESFSAHERLSGIENMDAGERKRYQTDAAYRKRLDELVAKEMPDPLERSTAQSFLGQIAKTGERPVRELIEELTMQRFSGKHDPAKAILTIENSFTRFPHVRESIIHPKTQADRELRERLIAVTDAITGNDPAARITRARAELLELGHLTPEGRSGLMSEQSLKQPLDKLRDLVQATDAMRPSMLASFHGEERAIAQQVMKQGKILPEDRLRALVLGWARPDEFESILSAIPKDKREALEAAYRSKYKSELRTDVHGKFTQAERERIEDLLDAPRSTAESERLARLDRAGRATSGMWAPAGRHELDSALATDMARAMKWAREGRQPSEKERAELADLFAQHLRAYRENRDAAADAAADFAVGLVAVGGSVVTGGVSLGLLVGAFGAGAAIKVGVKYAAQRGEYDASGKGLFSDISTGGLNGLLNLVGPGEIAGLMRLGAKSAGVAAASSFRNLAGQYALEAGSQEVMRHGFSRFMANALAQGGKGLEEKAVQKAFADLADKCLSKSITGEARQQAIAAMSKQMIADLNQGIAQESRNYIKSAIVKYATHSGAGGAGGAAAGGYEAALKLDPRDGFDQNLQQVLRASLASGGFGAAGAGAFTGLADIAGGAYKLAKPTIARAAEHIPGRPAPKTPGEGGSGGTGSGGGATDKGPKQPAQGGKANPKQSAGDGGRPVGDGGRPAGDGGRPVGNGGRPVGDGGRPVGDGGRPRPAGDGGQRPAVEKKEPDGPNPPEKKAPDDPNPPEKAPERTETPSGPYKESKDELDALRTLGRKAIEEEILAPRLDAFLKHSDSLLARVKEMIETRLTPAAIKEDLGQKGFDDLEKKAMQQLAGRNKIELPKNASAAQIREAIESKLGIEEAQKAIEEGILTARRKDLESVAEPLTKLSNLDQSDIAIVQTLFSALTKNATRLGIQITPEMQAAYKELADASRASAGRDEVLGRMFRAVKEKKIGSSADFNLEKALSELQSGPAQTVDQMLADPNIDQIARMFNPENPQKIKDMLVELQKKIRVNEARRAVIQDYVPEHMAGGTRTILPAAGSTDKLADQLRAKIRSIFEKKEVKEPAAMIKFIDDMSTKAYSVQVIESKGQIMIMALDPSPKAGCAKGFIQFFDASNGEALADRFHVSWNRNAKNPAVAGATRVDGEAVANITMELDGNKTIKRPIYFGEFLEDGNVSPEQFSPEFGKPPTTVDIPYSRLGFGSKEEFIDFFRQIIRQGE